MLPPAKAAEVIFTGQPISAQEALRWGLVNEVVPSAKLMETAEKYAARIMESAPLAVRATKEVIRKVLNGTMEEALRLEWAKIDGLLKTKDWEEGRQAFMEKRKPNFRGE